MVRADSLAILFSQGEVITQEVVGKRPNWQVSSALDTLVPRLIIRLSPYFGKTVVDAEEDLKAHLPDLHGEVVRTVLAASDNRMIFDRPEEEGSRERVLEASLPSDLSPLQARAGSRLLLVVQSSGSVESDATQLISLRPRHWLRLDLTLIDAAAAEVVWHGQTSARIDPEDPEHVSALVRSALLNLFTGRDLHPRSFLSVQDQEVVAYTVDGERISGRAGVFEDFTLTIEADGKTRQVPVEELKVVNAKTGVQRLFPYRGEQ